MDLAFLKKKIVNCFKNGVGERGARGAE